MFESLGHWTAAQTPEGEKKKIIIIIIKFYTQHLWFVVKCSKSLNFINRIIIQYRLINSIQSILKLSDHIYILEGIRLKDNLSSSVTRPFWPSVHVWKGLIVSTAAFQAFAAESGGKTHELRRVAWKPVKLLIQSTNESSNTSANFTACQKKTEFIKKHDHRKSWCARL